MRSIRITLCFTVLLVMAGRLFAQAGATGTILGTVTDSQVPSCRTPRSLSRTQKPTSTFQTVTSSAGDYQRSSSEPRNLQGHRGSHRAFKNTSTCGIRPHRKPETYVSTSAQTWRRH